jgi:hypothetical protein
MMELYEKFDNKFVTSSPNSEGPFSQRIFVVIFYNLGQMVIDTVQYSIL